MFTGIAQVKNQYRIIQHTQAFNLSLITNYVCWKIHDISALITKIW